MTPSLAELQQSLRASVTQRTPVDLGAIVDGPRVSAQDRLQVYTDAYRLRLLDSLTCDFPATRRALGHVLFERLATDYLEKHPSISPNISDAGSALANFSSSHPVAQEAPYLEDLLRLEWAVLEALYIDRLSALDPATLQGVAETAWAQATIVLDPTVRLLQTAWPMGTLWDKRRAAEPKHRPQLSARNCFYLIYRDNEWVQLKILDAARWTMLELLKEGTALGPACAEIEHRFTDQRLPVMEWFSHWIGTGVIKRVEVRA